VRLSPAELQSRLAFDYRVMRALDSDHLSVRPYASVSEMRSETEVDEESGLRGAARLYLAEFRFAHLVGRDRTAERSTLLLDLLAGGSYPETKPLVTVVSRPLPWTHHVHPGSGLVCVGESWESSRGRMLAAQLVIHLMHLVNFDEPERAPSYVGWNSAAAAHWRGALKQRPFLPELEYPVLPFAITHGLAKDDAFSPAGETADAFTALGGFSPSELS